jgi:hypothetical protein
MAELLCGGTLMGLAMSDDITLPKLAAKLMFSVSVIGVIAASIVSSACSKGISPGAE